MIGEPLFDARAIAARVAELAAEMSADYAGRVPLLLGLSGSATFVADLAGAMAIVCDREVVAVSRYGESAGIELAKDTASVVGRDVILVDDTIDTGLTLQYVVKRLLERQPASLAVCTLLDRPNRRIADVAVRYRAFEVPDVYVVGYGLGYRGRYRELPALYAHQTWPR